MLSLLSLDVAFDIIENQTIIWFLKRCRFVWSIVFTLLFLFLAIEYDTFQTARLYLYVHIVATYIQFLLAYAIDYQIHLWFMDIQSSAQDTNQGVSLCECLSFKYNIRELRSSDSGVGWRA